MRKIQENFNIMITYDEGGGFNITPRASVRVTNVTEDSMTWKVTGLGNPARDYDRFEINYYGGGINETKTWTSSNSSYDTQITIRGLKSDTKYTGDIQARFNGKWFDCGSDYDRTDPEPVTPPTLNSIRISGVTTDSFDYDIRHSWGDYFNIEVWERSSGNLVWGSYNTNSSYGTATKLKPNTEYKIQASVHNEGGSDYDYVFVTTNKAPQLPNPIVSISPSVSSAIFSWNRPTGASILVCTIRDESTGRQSTRNWDAYSSPQTINGLSANQRHKVWFRYEPSSSNSTEYSPSDTVESSFYTIQKPSFYWSIAPTSGRDFTISASDWVVLQNVTNQWRKIKGLPNYSFTTPSRGGTFYAYYFNDVRTALSQISGISGLPSSVRIGGDCYATDFVKFQNAINNLQV